MPVGIKSDFSYLDCKKLLWPYSGDDADATIRLFRDYAVPSLKEQDLLPYWKQQTCLLSQNLVKSEVLGFKMSRSKMALCDENLHKVIRKFNKEIKKEVGNEEFNHNSPVQLRKFLFEDLGLEPIPDAETESGLPGTGKEVLNKLFDQTHNVTLEKILDIKKLEKLQSVYIKGFQKFLDKKDYVHTSFDLCRAVTGRVVSRDPAIVTVPRDKDYKIGVDKLTGKEKRINISVRDMFICEENEDLIYADVAGFQLRLIAILANDPVLLDIFEKGGDPHDVTAKAIFDDYVPKELAVCEKMLKNTKLTEPCQVCAGCFNITKRKTQRDGAKRVNFGIAFGSGSYYLSLILRVSLDKVNMIRDAYLTKYPGIAKYMKAIPLLAQRERMLRTPYNRTRHFYPVDPHNKRDIASQWRMALNFLPQATEADIMIEHINMICAKYKRYKMKAWPRNFIYDSLTVVCPKKETKDAKEILAEVMSRPIKRLGNRRFSFNVGVGSSWMLADKDSDNGKYELSMKPVAA